MSNAVDDVRVLPFRVRPLPDEPFDSWLETMAAAYQASISEIGCALGLIEQHGGVAVSATTWMANGWATKLTDQEATRLEASTGIRAEQFHEMTRMKFARHAIRYTRQGRVSARCPAGGTGGRYCPECLEDSGGRWRMSWQFPFGFACHRHRRILVDTCPVCHRQPRIVGHPLALVPVPGQCHNPIDSEATGPKASRCRGDLSIGGAVIEAPPAVLVAQQRLMRIISTGQARFGIYEDAPQPALPALEDVRLLARVACGALNDPSRGAKFALPADLVDAYALPPRGPREERDSALGTAIGNAVAIAALVDPDAITTLLRGRLAESTSYTLYTPQMQTLIAASLGRSRRPTMFLQSATLGVQDPSERARKVPAQMWDEWMQRHAMHRIDHDIVASALSAAVVFTGTRLTHSAALALLDPKAPARRVTSVMRELGRREHETGTLRALLRLTAYLDTHDVPIDYARRRALNYTDLLPEEKWEQLCRRLNVHLGGGPRWRHAQALLHRMITGSALGTLPIEWGSAGVTTSSLIAFDRTLPGDVRVDLEKSGRDFLTRHRVDEPLTWTPPLDDPPDAPSAPESASWPTARTARADLAAALPLDKVAHAYEAGGTTYAIARQAGVSRQTVARALADAGVVTRRGPRQSVDIDERWLREQYEDNQRTIDQVAELAGCSPTTVIRRLHAAGIVPRPRGGTAGRWSSDGHDAR